MKKKSITAIKKDIHSMIREVVIQFKPLDTERIKVDNPERVSAFVQEKIGNDARESFILLCIGNKNEIVSYSVISVGTITEAIVHPREVFLPAIMTKASGVIVAHNHPSGSNLPSRQDIETTKRLVEAGKVIGIQLVDHIIVGFNDNYGNYYSMKENGYID
jgi:DNA repair protein RadC